MNVILGAQLRAIVIPPGENTIILVNDADEAAAHRNLINAVIEYSLKLRVIYPTLEEWSEPLYSPNEAWKFFEVLNKSVRAPCAEWPPPKNQLIILMNEYILRVVRNHC